jgi:hypothetical protein
MGAVKKVTFESIGFDYYLATWLCTKFAEDALPHVNSRFPNDKRGFLAIEAAKKWLKNPSLENAYAAGRVSYRTPSFFASAYYASACCAAAGQPNSSSELWAERILNTSYSAFSEIRQNWESVPPISYSQYSWEIIRSNMDYIISYKVKSDQRFSDPEAVMNAVSDEMKEKMLWVL